MKSVELGILKVEQVLVTLLIAVTFLSVVLQVFVRFFKLPVPDSSDLSLIAIASMTFLCIGMLCYRAGHISVEVTNLLTSKKALFAVRMAAYLGVLAFVAIFGGFAMTLLSHSISSGEATVQMRIPMSVPYAALMAGLVLAAFHTCMNIWRDIVTLRDPDGEFDRAGDAEAEDALESISPDGHATGEGK